MNPVDTFFRFKNALLLTPLRHPVNYLQHLGFPESAVVVASYPKSGMTWLRFMLNHLVFRDESTFERVDKRIPGVKRHRSAPPYLPDGSSLIQTHEPYRSSYRKAVYLVRDVRDVVISEYYYMIMTRALPESTEFSIFLQRFLDRGVNRYGTWNENVESWLAASREVPVCVVRYEDLKTDPRAELRRVVDFLKLDAPEELIDRAVTTNTVEQMRSKEEDSRRASHSFHRRDMSFVRKGKAGGWRMALRPDDIDLIEKCSADLLTRLRYGLASPAEV